MSTPTIHPWRTIAAEIIAAAKADPEALRHIYDDKEFRPGRNASVWMQLSARLAQARKAYREAAAKGCQKEVQHTMLRRCFAHDYSLPGSYMITMAVPERGSNPFGSVKGDVRQGRNGITVTPEDAKRYAALANGQGPLRLELTPLGAAIYAALGGISTHYPMVTVSKAQLMPDHLHLILEVKAPIVSSNGTPRHLGHVVAGFKKGCNRVYWDICSMGEPWNTGEEEKDAATTGTTSGAESTGTTGGAATTGTTSGAESTGTTGGAATTGTTGGAESMGTTGAAATTPTAGGDESTGMETGGVEQFSCSTKRAASDATTGRPTLWAPGYTDTIILSHEHMTTEEAYLDDNIYRLRMKQLHRDLFRKVHHIRINGQDFAALGNIHLLRRPLKAQVQFHHWEQDVPAGYWPCDRSWHCQRFYSLEDPRNTYILGQPIVGPTEAEAHTERLLKAGDEGTIFVSPFISETEKALRTAALTLGIPYIRLTREGFRDLFTPTRSEFEACCEGDLLLLAPWEDRRRTTTITRSECMALNHIAAAIAADGLELTLVNDNEIINDTIIPREDE